MLGVARGVEWYLFMSAPLIRFELVGLTLNLNGYSKFPAFMVKPLLLFVRRSSWVIFAGHTT